MNKEKFLKLKTEDLPSQCYGLLPSTHEIITIKKYQNGYFKTNFKIIEDEEKANEVVNYMNAKRGTTEEQRKLMELKSISGNW